MQEAAAQRIISLRTGSTLAATTADTMLRSHFKWVERDARRYQDAENKTVEARNAVRDRIAREESEAGGTGDGVFGELLLRLVWTFATGGAHIAPGLRAQIVWQVQPDGRVLAPLDGAVRLAAATGGQAAVQGMDSRLDNVFGWKETTEWRKTYEQARSRADRLAAKLLIVSQSHVITGECPWCGGS